MFNTLNYSKYSLLPTVRDYIIAYKIWGSIDTDIYTFTNTTKCNTTKSNTTKCNTTKSNSAKCNTASHYIMFQNVVYAVNLHPQTL